MSKRITRSLNTSLNIKWNRDIVLAVILGSVGTMVALAMFFLSGYMITQSALGAPLFALMGLIVSVKLFGFTRAITRYYERLYSHRATFTMLRDVRVQFYKTLVPIVPNVFRHFKTSDLLGKMVSQIESLQNIYLRVYYPPIVIGLTSIITIITLLFFTPWHAVLIAIVMVLSLWVVPNVSAKRALTIKQKLDYKYTYFMHRYFDFILGYEELKRFNQLDAYKDSLDEAEKQLSEAEHQEQMFHILYQFILNIISMIAIFLTILCIIFQIKQGAFDPVLSTSTVLMLLTLFEQHVMLSQVAYYKAETDQATQQLNEVMTLGQVAEGDEKITVDNLKDQTELFHLDQVTHRFPTQEQPVLKSVQLKIKKGEHVAILGASGSGKSTLLHLLMGLYPVTNGTFNIAGTSQFHHSHWLTQVNALTQDAQFFDGSIKENLLINGSEKEDLQALERVGLAHIALERNVTLNREALSGGEFQRLALARLWLKGAPVWILDEPTQGIDAKRAANIMSEIHKSADTLIVATHDLNILSGFDTVYKMIDGKLQRYQQV
ncbi:thiol reductant ABC exporter subunit CydC [Staphylococcus chromogenes]|uniref:thiol reductant ABC exporter subunit CydC n=1 Tax=Staphylococcus chromogenes TaxID=46126 RepID=UPI003D7B8E74